MLPVISSSQQLMSKFINWDRHTHIYSTGIAMTKWAWPKIWQTIDHKYNYLAYNNNKNDTNNNNRKKKGCTTYQ